MRSILGTTALREFLLLHPNVSSNNDVGAGYFEEPQFFAGSNYAKGLVLMIFYKFCRNLNI
jgi:hypothetical protein